MMKDYVRKPVGVLTLNIRTADSVVTERYCNMILDNMALAQSRVMKNEVDYLITQFGVGVSSVPPATSNTSLSSAYKNQILSITNDDGSSVTFHFTLSPSEANGMNIREFGLYTTNNTLVARRVRTSGAIAKDNTKQIDGTWQIFF